MLEFFFVYVNQNRISSYSLINSIFVDLLKLFMFIEKNKIKPKEAGVENMCKFKMGRSRPRSTVNRKML